MSRALSQKSYSLRRLGLRCPVLGARQYGGMYALGLQPDCLGREVRR